MVATAVDEVKISIANKIKVLLCVIAAELAYIIWLMTFFK